MELLGQAWPELNIVAQAENGLQALQAAEAWRPEVLFLDIQIPGVTGLEVARRVEGRCLVVFITAYDEHAVAAFDHGAADYLLKPLSAARLFTALSRVRQRLSAPAAIPLNTAAPPEESWTSPAPPPARNRLRWINASVGQTLRLITVDEVLYFQSDTKYTRVVTRDGEALIRKPLKELCDELDDQQFWQIHRSTLVNVAAIAGVTRDFRGRLQLRLKDRSEQLLVAESASHLFRQM